MPQSDCPLCVEPTPVLWRNSRLRVIDAADPAFPGLTRVIWNDHVREMTQLDMAARRHFMDVVWVVEQTLRTELSPDKINLAQLGNQVPHLHWHVIPRWTLDTHYPQAIWADAARQSPQQQESWAILRARMAARMPACHAALRRALETM
jgi:diadenosine tetraphosphate (Ap4A) HIT family hydrolase